MFKKIFNNTRSRFVELHNVNIEIVFTPMFLSTMNCRPRLASLVFPWRKRRYIISVNSRKNFGRYSIPVESLSDEVLAGWFGHELSHVVQYEKMSLIELIAFPFKYFFNLDFRKNFEIEATHIAREIGFGNELSEVEKFLRNDRRVNKKYQERFRRFYILD